MGIGTLLARKAKEKGVPVSRNQKSALIYYLAHGTVLKRDIEPGVLVTADLLEPADDALLWKLRHEQDKIFFS